MRLIYLLYDDLNMHGKVFDFVLFLIATMCNRSVRNWYWLNYADLCRYRWCGMHFEQLVLEQPLCRHCVFGKRLLNRKLLVQSRYYVHFGYLMRD
jgi:hypothetical protein